MIRIDYVAKAGDNKGDLVTTKTVYASTPLDAAYMLKLIGLAHNLNVSARDECAQDECAQLDALLELYQ